jgi:lipid-A-disaccharide synthase
VKYFIIAGEASGDLHGSNLITELLRVDPEADICCWGGDRMEKAGGKLLVHYRKLAVMGIWEVLVNIGKIFRNLRKCRQQILDYKPDLVILIDYPGFNMRIARYLKSSGINVYYYISPKVWAWNKSRIKKIKEYVNRMYVIFPFEPEFYEKYNYRVHYFGNPLVETVHSEIKRAAPKDKFMTEYNPGKKPVIALLPGSRVQEIKKILPLMARIGSYYPTYQLMVAAVGSVDPVIYENILAGSNIKVVYDDTYSLLINSEAALVTSGTATLETAIAGIPEVVCYRTSWLTYIMGRALVKIRFISLVNLIMDREIVKELIQDDLNEKNLVSELNAILPGGWKREIMLQNYARLRKILSGKGATARIATDMYHSIKLVNNVN